MFTVFLCCIEFDYWVKNNQLFDRVFYIFRHKNDAHFNYKTTFTFRRRPWIGLETN